MPIGSRHSAAGSNVKLKIYDFMGKEVKTLVDEDKGTGKHQVIFDASGWPAGVYFYQLQVNGAVETKKMVLYR
jgi:flagellar hook assembly protein FlgD